LNVFTLDYCDLKIKVCLSNLQHYPNFKQLGEITAISRYCLIVLLRMVFFTYAITSH